MVNRRSACSTRQRHPFGSAVEEQRQTDGEKGGLPRIIENQIIVRGAPVVGRSLTAVGASAMAAGIAVRSKPVKQKQFSVVKKSERKWKMKHHHGSDWKRHWKAERAKYVHYRSYFGSPQIDIQERRVRRANQRRQARRGVVLRGAGTVAMTGGQLVPIVAYGYVASRYLQFGTPGQDTAPGMPRGVQTETIVEDLSWIHEQNVASIVGAYQAVSMTAHVTETIVRSIF